MNNEINSSLRSIMPTPERKAPERPKDQQASRTSENRAATQSSPAETALTAADTRRALMAESESPPQVEREKAEQAAAELARRAQKMGRDLRFEVDDDSGMTVVKVIDRSTDEVVRQIPSEEAVARAATGDDGLNLIDATA